MKIHALTEVDKPFVYLTTGKAFENLSKYYDDCTVDIFDFRSWLPNITEISSQDVDIFIFEAVYLELLNISVQTVKNIYPKAKIVCLGSDTIYYLTTNKNNGYQFNNPQEVDLFLETMDQCIVEYSDRGINADLWLWTLSDYLVEECSTYATNQNFHNKEHDFIGVYSPHTIERKGSYRNRMVNYINAVGLKFVNGGAGQHDNDVDMLFQKYAKSKFTLGTTSHDNPKFHGMKGFRDWIGPFMNSLLIYDDYPQVIKDFYGGTLVPIYGYEKFNEIAAIHSYFTANQTHYAILLEEQRKWAIDNTIEKQLVKLFAKHGIV